jgi:glycosyltransferase involved in cell wall biosynthesis
MCSALIRAGCACAIACQQRDRGEPSGLDAGVAISVLDIRRNPLANREGKAALLRFIQGVDALHLHGLWDPLPCLAARLAREQGKPYIVSLHGMLLERSIAHHRLRKRLFLAALGNHVLRGAAALHFTTQAELDQATLLLPSGPERVVIPLTIESALLDNPPDANRWRQYFPQLPDSWPRLLFLSRIHPVKNLPSLIAAIPALAAEFSGLHLVVAGGGDPGYVRKMHALAESSAKAKRIVFVGPTSGEAKAALICSSTVMVIPSFHENFGMAVAEGLACSVPTLVTPGLGIGAEILAHGAGFSCGEESNLIAASLARALRAPDELRAAGENGRRWAIQTLAPQAVSERFIAVYRGIARGL